MVHCTNDPFAVLGVDEKASKKDIMRVVTDAMRSGRHDARTIAAAQKILFNPITRAQAIFRYRLDFSPYAEPAPEVPLGEELPAIPRLVLAQEDCLKEVP